MKNYNPSVQFPIAILLGDYQTILRQIVVHNSQNNLKDENLLGQKENNTQVINLINSAISYDCNV